MTFKLYNNASETTFCDLFIRQENIYNFRRNREFQIPNENAVWKGSYSVRYFGPAIWDLITLELKYISSLENFKVGIRK